MSLTEKEREKLKELCSELGVSDSLINDQLTYQQNYAIIIKEVLGKIKDFEGKAQEYRRKLSSYLKKRFGRVLVPGIAIDLMDRYSKVVETCANVQEKVEVLMEQLRKGRDEIESIHLVEAKWEALKAQDRLLQVVDAYMEYWNHLLGEAAYLNTLLKNYFSELFQRAKK